MLNGNRILRITNNTKNFLEKSLTKYGREVLRHSITDGILYGDEWYDENVAAIIGLVRESTSVFWDANIMDAAMKGCGDVFCGKTMTLFKPDNQLWISAYCDSPQDDEGTVMRQMVCVPNGPEKYGVECLGDLAELVYCGDDGHIQVYIFLEPNCDQLVDWNKRNLPPFIIFGAHYKPGELLRPTNYTLLETEARIRFMSQPFIDRTSLDKVGMFSGAHVQRKRNDAKKVQIVYLRRREHHPTLSDGSPNPIDWSCQWLVQGHWRNQYHPSDQSRVPTFIQSYVKGPEGKPFKAPKERIFAAVR